MDIITLALAKKYALSLALGGATPIPGPPGPSGRQVELSKNATHVMWRYVGDAAWTNLIPIADLHGNDGETPEIGANGNWWIGGVDTGVSATPDAGGAIPELSNEDIKNILEGVS